MAREKLAWAEAQAGASLAQKEQEWEARIDTATSEAHQEASGWVVSGFGGSLRRGSARFWPTRRRVQANYYRSRKQKTKQVIPLWC